VTAAEREEMRADGCSEERRIELALAASRGRAWNAPSRFGIQTCLELCAALRRLFGDPPIDQRPWRGEDYRL
jgi:hypothetical protein